MNLFIVLIPVSVRLSTSDDPPPWLEGQLQPGSPTALVLVRQDGWLEQRAVDHLPPAAQAQRMVNDLFPGLWGTTGLVPPAPEPVGFTENDNGNIRLVYTVPAPVTSIAIPPPDDHRWSNLHAPEVDDVQIRDLVREHWRQQLEETSAATDLLPRYFSMSQLMDVYAAIWGRKLDWSGFQDWVEKRNSVLVEKVDSKDVQAATEDMLRREVGPAATAAAVGGAVTLNSPFSVALLSVGQIAPLAAVAGATAYQSSTRGRRPKRWYQRGDGGQRIQLKNIYQPRPQWILDATPSEPNRKR